ncbi:MAG: thioredoxin domain-containing protein [Desulfovibrionaceae bacterium]|jgi:uncharacterized protein YyaL (SSP411 family)|nr:thioredoxin domain-containing protein [Desulfovibrionaceae bacterium]
MPNRNRLADELSPYLQQHADNPVDWWPWCAEAFAEAARRDVPVFLSVGYATCHWCHVMAHESFEHEATARLLNENFVCVKVDREERPDVDAVYMDVCQMLTGSGGWPLTVLMAADKTPFFAATYIPRESRFGRNGLAELIPAVRQAWDRRRDDLLAGGREVVAALQDAARAQGDGGDAAPELDASVLAAAEAELAARFDAEWGGFGSAPKFPSPHVLLFLLRRHRRTGDARSLDMVLKTLAAMRAGGVFDHVGGGFHRYATDRRWFVPHFEKMLYDQALLVMAYAEAWQVTGDPALRRTAEETIEYVLRDLRTAEGAFCCAEDADSEGLEGRFYTFGLAEVRRLLDPDTARAARRAWDLSAEGNHRDEATGEPTGLNILRRPRPAGEVAAELGIAPEELERRLETARSALFAARARRVRPLRDDKVLADWNGLMIAALALAGRVFDMPRYVAAAERAADFVLARMRVPAPPDHADQVDQAGPDGPEAKPGAAPARLLHRHRSGVSSIPALLDDYAFLAWGLIELHQATLDGAHLEAALELTNLQLADFLGSEGRGFHLTAHDAEPLPARPRTFHDAAVPSGNSVALHNLLRLSLLTGRADLDARARELLRAAAAAVRSAPSAHAFLLCGLDLAVGPAARVVVATARAGCAPSELKALLDALRSAYRPEAVTLLRDGATLRLAPNVLMLAAQGGRATAYVCRGQACSRPVTDPAALAALLDAAPAAPPHPENLPK